MKPDQQMQILDKFQARMRSIITSKREDYANDEDVLINFKRAGFAAGGDASTNILNLMGTKIARAAELCKGKVPNHESMDDTILDLANYCFLLYCVRQELDNAGACIELDFGDASTVTEFTLHKMAVKIAEHWDDIVNGGILVKLKASDTRISVKPGAESSKKSCTIQELADAAKEHGAELTADGFVIGGGKWEPGIPGRIMPYPSLELKPFNEQKMELNKPGAGGCELNEPKHEQHFPVNTVGYWLNKINDPRVRAAAMRNVEGANKYKKCGSVSDAIAMGWFWSRKPYPDFWSRLREYYLGFDDQYPHIPDDL